MSSTSSQNTTVVENLIAKDQFLEHWQGHRKLTRKVIEAFPEKEFFEYSIGGMRPFAEMVMELIGIAVPGLKEILKPGSAELKEHFDHSNKKSAILKKWDEQTPLIDEFWEKISLENFNEDLKIFGMYEGTGLSHVFYFIDNEIHHRGQGYVYLRSLGITPPYFWER